jgi:predicted nucleic-acid-binding Zn-ribbon protein
MSDFKQYLNSYKFDCVLPGSGKKITFKPITTLQMKNLLTYEKEQNPMVLENAMDDLIKSCVVDEGFDPKELYLQDRFYLLVEIRKKTKGELYKFSIKCPKCNSQSLNVINLDGLKVKMINKEASNRVQLNENIAVDLQITTRKMQDEAYKYAQPKENDIKSLTNFMIATYAKSVIRIVTPEGEEDISFEDKIFLLENITQGEYTKITDWFEENDFGVDFTFKMECKHCDYSEDMSVPMSDFFF